MALIVTFVLGILNFACHRAVLESGHVMLTTLAQPTLRLARLASMGLEFVLLCAALFAVANGHTHWLGAYLAYSVINCGAAWLIASRRI